MYEVKRKVIKGAQVKKKSSRAWCDEIERLMIQFDLKAEVKRVIAETERESKSTDTNEVKYDRAWRKFKSIMMTA